jgi:hypothetical protein
VPYKHPTDGRFCMAKKKSDDFVELVKKKFKRDKEYWGPIYDKGLEDIRFLSDDQYAQWNESDYNDRVQSNRPALTIDQLGQFVHQVVNDIRINTPTINVIPSGPDSDKETADAIRGIIKSIEYASNADNAYDTAASNQVKGSIGFLMVDHDYTNENGFDQELKIRRVVNPFSIYLDSSSIEVDGRDAKHATIIERLTVDEFEEEYPDADVSCFEDDAKTTYKKDDEISIAHHFYFEETERVIAIDEMGNTFDYIDGMPAKRTRKVKDKKVKRCKLSGVAVLEETYFPGSFIPVVPVYGEEAWIDGERHIMSLIRRSKDAQRMFNYWKSLETELLMKAPQAPFAAAEGQVDDYAQDWLNPSKAMVLRYKVKADDGTPLPPPQRLEPPTIPVGVVNASRMTVDDIKATMGIYNASLGQRSNEQSGVAIAQRKQEGDVATYHFSDNLMKSICQVGRILVYAIPSVYDTARVLNIIGLEDEPQFIGINGAITEGQEETVDLNRGKYDVKVVPGPSYTTLRQEAMAALSDTFQKVPELMNVMGDLYFKNADFAGATAMAERMKKAIDPKYLDEDERETPQIDPEKVQLTQAVQVLQQQNEQLQQELKSKQADLAVKIQTNQSDYEVEKAKLEVQAVQLQLEQSKASLDAQYRMRELELKEREMAIKEYEATRPDPVQEVPIEKEEPKEDVNAQILTGVMQVLTTALQDLNRPKQIVRDQNGLISGVI